MEKKYANLLVDYCLEIKKGDMVFVQSTPLASTLLKEFFRIATRRGAWVEFDLRIEEQERIFFEEAYQDLIELISTTQKYRFSYFNKYIYINEPYNLSMNYSITGDLINQSS